MYARTHRSTRTLVTQIEGPLFSLSVPLSSNDQDLAERRVNVNDPWAWPSGPTPASPDLELDATAFLRHFVWSSCVLLLDVHGQVKIPSLLLAHFPPTFTIFLMSRKCFQSSREREIGRESMKQRQPLLGTRPGVPGNFFEEIVAGEA